RAAWVAGGALATGIVCGLALRGSVASHPPAVRGDMPPEPVISTREAQRFVGSEVCASCHLAESRTHARSLHSHTLALIEKSNAFRLARMDQTLSDPDIGVTYSWRMEGGRPFCRVYRNRDGASEEMTPRYVVGSGHHGYTFLFERKGKYMESRL